MKTFRAHVGDRSFDFELAGDELRRDGAPVAYSFEAVGGGLYSLIVEGEQVPVFVREEGSLLQVQIGDRIVPVRVQDETALLLERFGMADASSAADTQLKAPMPGLVLKVLVEPGQAVAAGDGLLVLEAMKMENELRATHDATIAAIHVAPGEAVSKNALLLEFDA